MVMFLSCNFEPVSCMNHESDVGDELLSYDSEENTYEIADTLDLEKVSVCPAKKEDLNNIFSIVDGLSLVEQKYLALKSKRTLIRQMIRRERHCHVAKYDGLVVGFFRESGRPNGFSLLEELFVAPDYRGNGIANLLMDYYHSIFKKNMAKTNSSNKGMIHILKNHGYTAVNLGASRIINWVRDEK